MNPAELEAAAARDERLVRDLRDQAVVLAGSTPPVLTAAQSPAVTALGDARRAPRKAQEFLQAAEMNLDLELLNAATSDAVISGINSKDAICLALTGRTSKGDNHLEAVPELRRAGPAGAELATTMSRLLKLKTKSQYTPVSVAASDAAKAVEWARRLLAGAENVVAGR